MKNYIYILIVFLLFSPQVQSAVWTVDNNTGSTAQFTTIQQAVNAASSGDTIYVQGSPYTYVGFNFNIKLYFLGAGYAPISGLPTIIQSGDITGNYGSAGSKIEGFKINWTTILNLLDSNNVLINNQFLGTHPFGTCQNVGIGKNSIARNNIFLGNSSFSGFQNNLVSNNIFNRSLCNCSNCGGTSASINSGQNNIIVNNLFLNDAGSGSAINNLTNSTVNNNVFYGVSAAAFPAGINGCQFNNNITFGSINDTIPFGTNTGSGNFISTDPLFVNVPSGNYNFDLLFDYHFQTNSVGKNAGTDGTDIGIYGGTYSFTNFTGTPSLPYIQEFTIKNPVIGVGDPINIHVKAKNK